MDLESEFYQYACVAKLADGIDMTPAEITGAINAIKSGIDIFKNIADAKDQMKYAEITRVISSMNLELSKLENELATKNREIFKLELTNELLEKQIKELENLSVSFDPKVHCTTCYESNKKTITLVKPQDRIEARVHQYKKECPVCKTHY
jgi:chromosome segregation ATPase